MNETKSINLDDAVRAAKSLPSEAQDALAHEIMERVADFSASDRSPDRQAIIKQRLNQKLEAVSRDDLMEMLRRYNSSL